MVYMISVLNDTGSSFDIRLLETLGEKKSMYLPILGVNFKRIFFNAFLKKTANFLPLVTKDNY